MKTTKDTQLWTSLREKDKNNELDCFYVLSLLALCHYDHKITKKRELLARIGERFQGEVWNEGGNGFVMPFIPVIQIGEKKHYLPSKISSLLPYLTKLKGGVEK